MHRPARLPIHSRQCLDQHSPSKHTSVADSKAPLNPACQVRDAGTYTDGSLSGECRSGQLAEIKPKRSYREIDTFTALLAIIDFIDNEMPTLRSVTDVKIALVLLRKTFGWGRRSEEIGATELGLRAGVDKDVLKNRISPLCARLGVTREQRTSESKSGNMVPLRTRYEWPINDRVRKMLDKKPSTGAGLIQPVLTNRQGGVNLTPRVGRVSPLLNLLLLQKL